MKQIYLSLLLLLLPAGLLFAQELKDAGFEFADNQITVTYTLANAKEGQTFDVVLLYSTNNGSTWQTAYSTSGDIGKKVSAGKNRRIVWNLLADLPGGLDGSIGFKVKATVYDPAPPPKPTPSPKPALSFEPEMVLVQGGTYTMGSPETEEGRSTDEKQHHVTLTDFYIGKYEVTQAQWRAVMGSDPPELWNSGCDNCPVENVSWNDVQDFLKKLNDKTGRKGKRDKKYTLPTEAQWEYAARGGQQSNGYKYAGSNDIEKVAWYDENYKTEPGYGRFKCTHPVGTKDPNELGLYDMSGNVFEWCSDWYDYGYYSNSPSSDPENTRAASSRVLRGGSWFSFPTYCRAAYRNDSTPSHRRTDGGVRVVLAP